LYKFRKLTAQHQEEELQHLYDDPWWREVDDIKDESR